MDEVPGQVTVHFFGTGELGFVKPVELESAHDASLAKRLKAQHGKKRPWKKAFDIMMVQVERSANGDDDVSDHVNDVEGNQNKMSKEHGNGIEQATSSQAKNVQEKRKRQEQSEREKKRGKRDLVKRETEEKVHESSGAAPTESIAEGVAGPEADASAEVPADLPPGAVAIIELKQKITSILAKYEEESSKAQMAEEKAEEAMKKAQKLKSESEAAKRALLRDARELEGALHELAREKVDLEILEVTNIGISVKKWRKREFKDPLLAGASAVCKQILGKWMGLISSTPKDTTTGTAIVDSTVHPDIVQSGDPAPEKAEMAEHVKISRPESNDKVPTASVPTHAPKATEDIPRSEMQHGVSSANKQLKSVLSLAPGQVVGAAPEEHGQSVPKAQSEAEQGKLGVLERFQASTGSALRDKGRKILKRHLQGLDRIGGSMRALELTMELEQELCEHLGIKAGEEPGKSYKLLMRAVCNSLDGTLGQKLLAGTYAAKEMVRLSAQASG